MGYRSWFDNHAKKHKQIMQKLQELSDDEIIEYFKFENMQKNEPDFCPLYAKNIKCHEIKQLNCYLCACPNFRFDDNAPKIKSYCSIDFKDGKQIESNGFIHQDCSNCTIPHKQKYIKQNFSKDWKDIMSVQRSLLKI